MSADTLIESLSAIHPKGYDLSLDRILRLLERLGNPHEKIPPVLHFAGTNGKGSTIAFCRSILEAAGYRVHVHTSPHLVNWHERYRLNGRLVEDAVFENAIQRAVDANANQPVTVFELLSAVMFILFSETPADYCLVEVGLGGRFDATNVIRNPVVCAITPVSLDHQSYLGNTIEQIAFEKGGIIKPGSLLVIGEQEMAARETLERIAGELGVVPQIAGQDFDCHTGATGFVYQDGEGLLDLPLPKLSGEYQLANAALAIAALRAAKIEIPEEAFAKGMQEVVWQGRLEKLAGGKITRRFGRNADIWIDGGHNPSAGAAIAKELARMDKNTNRTTLLVCGMINTKDPKGYFEPFKKLNVEVLAVPVAMSDAGIPPDLLAESASGAGLDAKSFESLEAGIEEAVIRLKQNPDTRILFCGSLYLAGEVLGNNGTPPQ